MESKVTQNTFNCCLLSVTGESKKPALVQRLQQQILAVIKVEMATDCLNAFNLTPATIPLHRQREKMPVIYRSAIAFKLARGAQLSILDLANQIMAALLLKNELTSTQQLLNPPQLESPQPLLFNQQAQQQELPLKFNIEVVSPGWIDFRLTDHSLAIWLQNLISTNSVKLQNHPATNTSNCFSIQYAHARCCSILRLADQQGLIILKDGQVLEPNPIPWLNDEQEATRQVELRLGHPAEKRLIALSLDILDAIDSLDRQQGLKLATSLSQAFEEFSKHCRIWGEVTQTPKLAQARLGLVAVTQGLLRSLLQDCLGVFAPVEL